MATPPATPPVTPPPVNPYRPPSSNVADIAPPSSGMEFAAPGIRADAGRGASWIGEGWELFKKAPLMWMVILVIMFGIGFVLGFIPGGGALNALMSPIFNVGLLAFARGLDNGEGADINRFFTGFQNKFGLLVGIGGLSIAMMMIIVIVAVILAVVVVGTGSLTALASASSSPQALSEMLTSGTVGLGLMLAVLVFLALILLAASATYFAPGLVFYANLGVMDAIRESFAAVWRNWLSLLVLGLVGMLLVLVSLIPFGLGIFVSLPVMMASFYPCFREIFGRRQEQNQFESAVIRS